MILGESELRTAIARRDLVFEPAVDDAQIGPASVDLRLSNEFLLIDTVLEAQRRAGLVSEVDLADYRFDLFRQQVAKSRKVRPEEGFPLAPGRLVLGYTLELIRLSNNLFGRVDGKSSLARLGLFVHITAPTVQPGFENHLQLELLNMGPIPIRLRPGRPICQLVVEEVSGGGTYRGQFQRLRKRKGNPRPARS